MGAFDPLQLGLDLAVEETTYSAAWAAGPAACFNWASTSRSRKLDEAPRRPGEGQGLQLGLDLAVEETLSHAAQRRAGRRASIGPRPRGRGNPPSSGTSTACPSCFNWASTSRSRKHDQGGAALDSTVVLQLGLDLAVEETPVTELSSAGFVTLQLGLDLAVEETPPRRSRARGRRGRFNWASTSRSRKPLASVSLQ